MREINTSDKPKERISSKWLFGLLILPLALMYYATSSSVSKFKKETEPPPLSSNVNNEAELREARRIQLLKMHEPVSDEFTRPRTFRHKSLRKMNPNFLTVAYEVPYFFSLTKITDQGAVIFPEVPKHRYNIKVLVADELYDMTPSSQLDDQRLAEVFLNATVDRIKIRTDMTRMTTDYTVEGEMLKAFKETLELAFALKNSPMNGQVFGSEQIAQMYAEKLNSRNTERRRSATDQIQPGVSSKERLRQLLELHERISDDFTRPREFRHKRLIQFDNPGNASLAQPSDFFVKTKVDDQGTVHPPWRTGYFIRVVMGDDLFVMSPTDRSDNQALAALFLYSNEKTAKIKTNVSGDIVEFTAEGELLKAFKETVELAELLKESPMK